MASAPVGTATGATVTFSLKRLACDEDGVPELLVIDGKPAVLEHIKKKIIGTSSQAPVRKIVIYDPYINVKENTAMEALRGFDR